VICGLTGTSFEYVAGEEVARGFTHVIPKKTKSHPMLKCSICGEISKDPTTERCQHCHAATATLVDMRVDHESDDQQTEVAVPVPAPVTEGQRFCLTLTHDESPQEQARLVPFRRDEQIIGRSETIDVYIALPSLSRRHASIWLKDGTPYIRDLGSLSGTLVNNVRITEPTALSAGDRVSLGDSVHMMTTLEEGAIQEREDLTIEKRLGSLLLNPAEDEPPEGRISPHLEIIASLCTKMTAAADEAELLSTVLEHLSVAIPATRFLALLGESVDELTVVAERHKAGASGPKSPPSKGILRRVMYSLSGRPFVTSHAQDEGRFKQRHSVMISDIQAVVCAGLTDGTTCIGMLYADGQVDDRELSGDDENLLFIVSQLTFNRIMVRRHAARLVQQAR
jgi:pSer/pThr/pTyr-binding forkhead associated (FHA) protein